MTFCIILQILKQVQDDNVRLDCFALLAVTKNHGNKSLRNDKNNARHCEWSEAI
ncbi:MAG: hypothetical protein LBM09_01895 [Candidatus Nomurabacteria bacterium]|jgi:hypothetical protein|nr:hypothetical protein [Candidatus Nomurabacteria bacterium]